MYEVFTSYDALPVMYASSEEGSRKALAATFLPMTTILLPERLLGPGPNVELWQDCLVSQNSILGEYETEPRYSITGCQLPCAKPATGSAMFLHAESVLRIGLYEYSRLF
ncbi:uncharacterized protein SPSK_10084 [Sporothrix schenckii 1099-18]|uniref:Uncharacterized protein n=1 Tax=Sporothrix schenckii 1099-18 TaxID=1397361 RepID=A0A0F2M6I6_SPOSC|nr:uncharacterized protein SPSK_10084 [Sporothrix schenckii 1099-18]KJR84415.1 hypothetical protein SPSK_10084 [Sporothrix schenckii 1099-18]